MSIESEGGPSPLVNLSALVDGELDAGDVSSLCTAWRDDAVVRTRWHAYQVIGDVLRSEDLVASATRDSAFLATLRARLALEPTVLAPEPVSNVVEPTPRREVVRMVGAARGTRWSWMAPSAVAAGFVLVAGALMVTRAPAPSGGASGAAMLARGAVDGVAPQTVVATTETTTFEPQQLGPTGKLVRNPKLDRYLAAHQQFAGTSALGVPSGFLRNAAAEAPNR